MMRFGRLGMVIGALALAGTGQAANRSGPEPDAVAATDTSEADKAEALGEALQAADLWVEQRRLYRNIPALSVAVAMGDRTVWAKGFGTTDRARQRPATADTIYSICSISKLFTAVALMQQWEAGKVALDTPLTEYLPWAVLAEDSRDSVPITLRGALTHSAGLPRESDYPYWTGPDFRFPTRQEVRDRIGTQAPLYPASTTFQYSNLGLTLVGETVAAVAGRPYAEQVQAAILDPLGLSDTRPTLPTELYGSRMAVGWGALRPDGTRPEVGLFDPAGIAPAAGFSSSVADLARFASWTFRLARSEEAEVLRPSTLREMERVHYITPDWETSWGLGFAVRNEGGTTVVGHGGSCPGYRSALMMAPKEEAAVAVAMNAMDDPAEIARGVATLFKMRGEAKPFDPVEGVDLADFAGIYDGQPWSADFALIRWAGGLTWLDGAAQTPAEAMWRLKPLGGDRFLVVADKGEERDTVLFERDRAGRVVAMVQHSNRSHRLRTLPVSSAGQKIE